MFPARPGSCLVAFEVRLAIRKNDHPIGFERARFSSLLDPAGIANGRLIWTGSVIGCRWLCLAHRSDRCRVGRRGGACGSRHRRSADWKGYEIHFVRPQSDALTRLGILRRESCQRVSTGGKPRGSAPDPGVFSAKRKEAPGEMSGARGRLTCRGLRSGRRPRKGRRGSRYRPKRRNRFRRSCAGYGA